MMEKQIEEIIASMMEIVDETETLWSNMAQKLKDLEERVKRLEQRNSGGDEHE